MNQMAEVMRIGSFIPALISLIILCGATVSDFQSDRIPNAWICIGLAAGVSCMIFSWTLLGWKDFFLGIMIPLLIGWIPFRMGAIGAGDVKILIVIGVLNGGQGVFFCIFFSFLFAAGISLGRLLILRQFKYSLIQLFQYFQSVFSDRKLRIYPGRHSEGHTIHFSAAILLGYAALLGVHLCRII